MNFLKQALFITPFVLGPASGPAVFAGKPACVQAITSILRNSKVKTADKILSAYAPYDKRNYSLTLLTETDHSAVIKACTDSGDQFILKVNSLSEAFNDYYGLKILKKLDPPPQPPVKIIDSVFLTDKNAKHLELYTKVLQKNPFTGGRPLAEILIDPNILTARKAKLYKHYMAWLKEVGQRLEASGFEVSIERPEENFYPKHKTLMTENPDFLKSQPALLKADKSWKNEFKTGADVERESAAFDHLLRGQFKTMVEDPDLDFLILIKSDNIMVNDADELTLFDPF
jgi:hypothetical protein